MRRILSVILGVVVGYALAGVLETPRTRSGDISWRTALVSSAHAQSCEYPPIDEPDGDGDECNPNYSSQVSVPKNQGDPCGNGCGNPINFATGGKYDAETDYKSAGPFPLALVRYYNSLATGVQAFGAKWSGSYGRSVVGNGSSASATRDDGKVVTFTLTNGVWTPEADVNFRMTVSGNTIILVTDQDETETYDANGRLVSISNRAGLTQTFARDSQGRLATATDPFGRALKFTYVSSSSPLVSQAMAPDGGLYSYAYDSGSRLLSVTFPDGSKRQYVYENTTYPSRLTGVVDENGARYATYAYDANGRAISTQHAGGVDLYTVNYTYLNQGVTSVTGPLGGVTSYLLAGVNGSAKQTEIYRSCTSCYYVGGYTDNTLDANGNLVKTDNFLGQITTYAYDTTRNLEISRTMASGTPIARTITTTWHPTFRLPTQIIDGSRKVTNTYDGRGNLLTTTLTGGNGSTSTRSFTYNSGGQVLTATDPRGFVTSYSYDARGNLASIVNALGQTTLFTSYDANGRPLAMQDANSVVTTLTYNFRGQITSKTTLARVTTYAYDAVGNLIKITMPDASYLALTYDAAHRLIGVADALGDTIAYTLDAGGNRIKTQVYDPTHNVVRTHSKAFDGFGRLARDIGATGATSYFYYDDGDNLAQATNANGVSTSTSHDALNRPVETYRYGAATYFAYDLKGRLSRVTDPRNLATAYTYDALDDQTAVGSPDAGLTSKTYDATGNLVTSVDADGHTTTYVYDGLNRVVSQTFSSGAVISLQYDQGANGIGRLTAMTDSTGATAWTYNRHGQVIQKQQTIGAVALTTRWAYTPNTGLLASMVYPSGATLSFSYNTNGQASAVAYQPPGGASASPLLSQIVYQPFGPLASWRNGNGSAYARTYDQDGRVATIAMPASTSIGLSYDAISRIVAMTETGLAAKYFTYDPLDRLTSYSSGTLHQTYGYDLVGNRTAFSATGASPVSLTYNYDTASNRLLSVAGGSNENFAYDAAGNLTAHTSLAGDYSFAYSARNRLSQSFLGAMGVTHFINGLGQRVAKLDQNSQAKSLFAYDEAGRLLGRYSSSGVLVDETVWLGDLPVAVLTAGGPLYVAPDHLGAPHQITNSAGQVVWLWDHDPFGNGLPTGTFTYNLRFPGQFYDANTGTHYNYFRDYDPKTGRYVESDPIGLKGGVSTYAYVGGNPVTGIDSLGLEQDTSKLDTYSDIAGAADSIWNASENGVRNIFDWSKIYSNNYFGNDANFSNSSGVIAASKFSSGVLKGFGILGSTFSIGNGILTYACHPTLENNVKLSLAITAAQYPPLAAFLGGFGIGGTAMAASGYDQVLAHQYWFAYLVLGFDSAAARGAVSVPIP